MTRFHSMFLHVSKSMWEFGLSLKLSISSSPSISFLSSPYHVIKSSSSRFMIQVLVSLCFHKRLVAWIKLVSLFLLFVQKIFKLGFMVWGGRSLSLAMLWSYHELESNMKLGLRYFHYFSSLKEIHENWGYVEESFALDQR